MAALTVGGTVRVPGDKSISHRALMLGALAVGRSRVRGILESADVHSTAAVLRALGARVPPLGDSFELDGCGLRGQREQAGEAEDAQGVHHPRDSAIIEFQPDTGFPPSRA